MESEEPHTVVPWTILARSRKDAITYAMQSKNESNRPEWQLRGIVQCRQPHNKFSLRLNPQPLIPSEKRHCCETRLRLHTPPRGRAMDVSLQISPSADSPDRAAWRPRRIAFAI